MKVEIYGAPWCGFCNKAKNECVEKDLDYAYYNIEETPAFKDVLNERLGEPAKTIPQIFIDGQHLPGGYNSFAKMLMQK